MPLPPTTMTSLLGKEVHTANGKHLYVVGADREIGITMYDIERVDVLQDQLTGVDCAYFMEVMRLVKDKHPERVNAAYLVEIVDRMF